jgi:hypothetical protein
MNNDIKSTVAKCPQLTLQLNKGERHRVMRSGLRRGSLWVTPRMNGYNVLLSGEADGLLCNFMRSHFGAETGEDQGYKYWNITDYGDVAKIIRRFGEQ